MPPARARNPRNLGIPQVWAGQLTAWGNVTRRSAKPGVARHAASAQDVQFPVGEGSFTWESYRTYADAHDLSGMSLSISGPWTGEDAELVNSVLAYFMEATGADAQYSGADSFENDIVISTRTNSAPDIAVFPQPGLPSDLVAAGAVTALAPDISGWIEETYAAGESWVEFASFEGPGGETTRR